MNILQHVVNSIVIQIGTLSKFASDTARSAAWLAIAACFFGNAGMGLGSGHANLNAQETLELSVQMRDGTVLQVQADDSRLDWNTVSTDGTITQKQVSLSEISSLELAKSPASKQVADIRRLVTELANDSYTKRHQAEKQLITIGKPFQTIIQQAIDHKEAEVRYRVLRILKQLEKTPKSNDIKAAIEFDKLVLSDGSSFEGDVVDWSLTCTWHGNAMSLDRTNIFTIHRVQPSELSPVLLTSDAASVTPLIRDTKFFTDDGVLKSGMVQAAFQKGPNGEELVTDKKIPVDEYFAFLGCLFNCEKQDGRVIISGFRFKQSRSKKNSIGNYYLSPETGKDVRYKGVLRIDFCLPNQASIPATVEAVGMFLEIVVPKHTMIEAYNSAGHIIGVTQSARKRNSFVGLDSNVPIAYIKVRANEYLELGPEEGELNRDFAVDDLCYSQPKLAVDINRSSNYVIVTKRGERVLAGSIQLTGSTLFMRDLTSGHDELSIPNDQVHWIVGPEKLETALLNKGVYVMTTDGSVVHCNTAMQLELSSQSNIKIGESDIVGIWGAAGTARYPQSGDFAQGSVVVVRPINRVATNDAKLYMADASVDIALIDAINFEQGLIDNDEIAIKSSAVPKNLGLDDDEMASIDLTEDRQSTIWFKPPVQRKQGTGLLRTYDGQQFVLNGEFGFKLDSVSQDSVSISHGDDTISFPLEKIKALEIPAK